MFGRIRVDKHVNKDVVLCTTTNHSVSRHATQILIDNAIPFTVNWKRIPLHKREEYSGASELCTFSINRNVYGKARRSISQLTRFDREHIRLNVI